MLGGPYPLPPKKAESWRWSNTQYCARLLLEAETLAKREGRTRSELLRETEIEQVVAKYRKTRRASPLGAEG
jgi:hypothetical protein